MRHEIKHKEAGFSLAELLVAMVMTLLVTGAIFGLLSSGQSAFKVQPERTERQQNIRTAMDLITRDAASAGVGMPAFVQTFTPALNGVGTTTGPSGANTDEIEILANTTGFTNEPACFPTVGDFADLYRSTLSLTSGGDVMVIFRDGSWTVRKVTATSTTGAVGNCTGATHVQLTMASGGINPGNVCQPTNTVPALGNAGTSPQPAVCGNPCCEVESIGFGSVVHYRIRPDATDVDDTGVAIPNLERSVNGGAFQVVARGVEDLQVRYLRAGPGSPPPSDNAQPVVGGAVPDFNTLITQVRVTLSTRSANSRLQGATINAPAGTALRGSLSSQATPRQALATLTTEGIALPKWN